MEEFRCVRRSKRCRKEERKGGVRIIIYRVATIDTERLRFKFYNQDADKLSYMISVALSEDGERIYFIPDSAGFTLNNEHGTKDAKVIEFANTGDFSDFEGDYKGLEYDEKEHLFYVSKASKLCRESKDETVTLTKADYDKIMQLIKEFA